MGKILLAEAVHCEHSGAYGYEPSHQVGRQLADELRVYPYYNRPWTHIYRAKDPSIAKEIAIRQQQACDNWNIGYGQATRDGYRTQLLKVNYDPSKIKTACDCDCSSLTCTNTYVTLLCHGIKTTITGFENTTSMPKAFDGAKAYFDNVIDEINLGTGEGLKVGDIVLRSPAAHTAVVCYVEDSPTTSYIYQGLDYAPVFNPKYYSDKYADLKKAFGDNEKSLFTHFCDYGMKEGRQACTDFNVHEYKAMYADLRAAFGDDLPKYYRHYLVHGISEHRRGTLPTPVIPVTGKTATPNTTMNVRLNPSLQAMSIGYADKGVAYAVIDTTNAEGRDWVKIKIKGDKIGWMSANPTYVTVK